MANEEKNDVIDQLVTDTQGEQGQLTTDKSEDAQVATEQQGDTTQPATEENRIPLSRLQEEIEKKRDAESRAKMLQEQLELTQQQQQQQAYVAPSIKSTYEQAINDLGYDPDYISEQDRIKIFERKAQLDNQVQQQQLLFAINQNFIRTHPDYSEVVGRPNAAVPGKTIPSEEIKEILQRKPYLQAAAMSSAEGAYNIVMEERRLKALEDKAGAINRQDAQLSADAKTAPMSSSAAGGGGSVATSDTNIAKLTPAEFAELEARVANGDFD